MLLLLTDCDWRCGCCGPNHLWLQALVLEAEEKLEAQQGGDRASLAAAAATFYEVTIASIDQPKLLSRLSESLVSGGKASEGSKGGRQGGCCCEQEAWGVRQVQG